MAIEPKAPALTVLEQEQKAQLEQQMLIFNEGFNKTLIGAAARPNNLISLSIGPKESEADIQLRSARTLLNAHMLQVHNTVSVQGDWNNTVSRLLSPDDAPNTSPENLSIYVAPFEVKGADLKTFVGGRTQANARTFGGDNLRSQEQYDVSEFTSTNQENFVRIRMATAADGALNSYAVAYVDQTNPETGDLTGNYSRMFEAQNIITRKDDVLAFNTALNDSQKLRTDMGLPDDDILRDPRTGLPHVSQPLDNFYANLPEKHPHYNITPYLDHENDFLRDMHEDLLNKQVRHDYAELVKLHQDQKLPITDAVVPIDSSVKAVNKNMRIIFAAQDNDALEHDSLEETGINVNRYTHRDGSEISAFLNTDPEIKRRAQFIAESVISDGPDAALRQSLSSDYNPDNVQFGSISLDVNKINPNSDKFKDLTYDQNALNYTRDVDFDLGKSKGYQSVIITQDKMNYDLAERLLDDDFSSLASKGVLTATTENLSMLNGQTTVPTLRALYKQVMEDRNDTNMTDFGTAAQTIVLSNRIAHDQINSHPKTVDWLAKANVAFIAPEHPYSSWAQATKGGDESLVRAREYLQEQMVDFSNKRTNLLDPSIKLTAPESMVNPVLARLITDHVLDTMYDKEKTDEKRMRVEGITAQIDKFEANFADTMNVLKNRTVKNTMSSMMAFASDQVSNDRSVAAPFNKLQVLLSEDFEADKGSSTELNALAVGFIGKMMIDSHLRQNDPSYPENSHHQRYDQHKQDAVSRLAQHITNDESFPHSKRKDVGEKTAQIVLGLMMDYPAIDDEQNRRLLKALSFAAQNVDISNQAQNFGATMQLSGAEPVAAPVTSPSVSPLATNSIEIDVASELKYSTLSKNDSGLFAKNADAAAFFASTAPIYKEVAPVARAAVEEAALMVFTNPEFRKLADAIKTGEPYNMAGQVLVADRNQPMTGLNKPLIQELEFFMQSREQQAANQRIIAAGGKIDPADKIHFDSADIKSMGSANPSSAAAELGLVYLVARKQDMESRPYQKGEAPGDYLKAVSATELKAADYPSTDHMILDLVTQKLNDFNESFSVDMKLLATASKGVKPLISKAFNESLRGHFTDMSDDVFSNDTQSVLHMKGIPEAGAANVLNRVNDVAAGVDPETLNEAVSSENYTYLSDTVKQSPDFVKFMDNLVTNQIEQPKNKFLEVPLDISDTISATFPALARIDSANFAPADPNSMVAQLELSGSIHQRHGSFKKTEMDMTKFESFDDAMVSYMADNLEYLDKMANIKLKSGNIESALKGNPEVDMVMKTLNDRNMGVAHPDMFKMNTAEFADKHFPNEINHEFDGFRAEPRNTISSAIALEIHVREQGKGDNSFTAAYKLSDYKTPEDLLAQQKSDFRGNENLTVAKVRCHNNGQDIARAVINHSKEAFPVYPELMPKELWTMNTEKYLTNDKLVKTADVSPAVLKELVEKSDISYKAVHAAPEPEVAKAKVAEPTAQVADKAPEPEAKVDPRHINDSDIGANMGM